MPNVSIPIAIQHQAMVLERLSAGERCQDIALDLGVTPQALSKALAHHIPDQYQEALKSQTEAKLADYENQLENASDGLSVSRARELLAHTRWKLERRDPARWGQVKQAIQVNTDGPATINIVSWADDKPVDN